MSIRSLLLAALCLALATAAHASVCPDDTLSIAGMPLDCVNSGNQVVAFHDTAGSVGRTEGPCTSILTRSQQATCNLRGGSWYARAEVVPSQTSATSFGLVSTHDEFTVLGPEGASPAAFTVRLGLTALCTGYFTYWCGPTNPNATCSMPSGDVSARLVEGAVNEASYRGRNTSAPLELTVTRAPGEAFTLGVKVVANAPGDFDDAVDAVSHAAASIAAVLSFPDLPAGWSVVSCQGYQAGQIVPTRNTTWGRLKISYR